MVKWNCTQIVFALSVLGLSLVRCSVAAEHYMASVVDHTWASNSSDSATSLRAHEQGNGKLGSNEDRKSTREFRVRGSCAMSPSVYGKIVRYASQEMFSGNQVHTEFLDTPVGGGDMVIEAHSYANGKAENPIDVFTDEYYFIGKDMRVRDIDLYSYSADIYMRDVVAHSLNAKSINGDIVVRHLPALIHVNVTSSSGDLVVHNSSLSGEMSTVEGDIVIRNSVLNADSDITLSSVNGDISVFLDCRKGCGNVRVSTISGRVHVIIGQVNGKSWTTSSVKGNIYVDDRTSRGTPFGRKSRSGHVSGGGPTSIHITSVSGDISLRFTNKTARIDKIVPKDCNVNSQPTLLGESSIRSFIRIYNMVDDFSPLQLTASAIIMSTLAYLFWKCIRCCCCCVTEVRCGDNSHYYRDDRKNTHGSYGSIPTHTSTPSSVSTDYSSGNDIVAVPSYFQSQNELEELPPHYTYNTAQPTTSILYINEKHSNVPVAAQQSVGNGSASTSLPPPPGHSETQYNLSEKL
eukprot:Nk52_evm3s254 gene=Nk52_evmTU3s254